MKNLFINRFGKMRSGWILLICMVLFYVLTYVLSYITIEILRKILVASGDINYDTGYYSNLADSVDDVMPVILQFMTEVVTIAIPFVAWKCMKVSWEAVGFRPFLSKFKKDGCIGLLLGFFCCTSIFVILLLTKNVVIKSSAIHFNGKIISWVILFISVGFAEELFNRGLLMSVLRRTNNKYLVMTIPSIIFGLIHVMNPHFTVISFINIILIGFVFSYMYYKSGNLWMCIGYHITWNLFQSVIYGMPVSGLNVDSLVVATYPTDNLLNGGSFGIEGGILTTAISILLMVFVFFYYRNSNYKFLPDKSNSNAD